MRDDARYLEYAYARMRAWSPIAQPTIALVHGAICNIGNAMCYTHDDESLTNRTLYRRLLYVLNNCTGSM